ncbi:sialidase family protein [Chitinophaga sp. Ak27]|uniref:sialidase family protein n=1 Tax=Chitinophaga sp. Ak27 TaxID=2726116 RepID=UPI00145FCDC1|nr:sialidase family protein [Chitinophaga sp. Ak27]NLU90494.1 exo-alpha-sialidase [Chitinophaga sp. Ak27]
MNKTVKLTAALLLWVIALMAQVKTVSVFTSDTEGYKNFRIPAIIRLPDGQLLAFAEGRVNNSGDFGDIKIVMKRSRDNGTSWSALQEVANNDSLQAGNPAPVIDLTDPAHPKGRIFLFYNTGNNHEGEIRRGKGLREVWYKTSIDGGLTWSVPVNITTQVHRPQQPQMNAAYNFQEDWRSYANTPGHATQFREGKYRGRIYVAANHSEGAPRPHFKDYFVHGYYTDDHGKTFHLSATLPAPGGNEATAAALSGGRLMINARNQQGNEKARIVATSANGGATWQPYYYDHQLPDPVCEGSLLEIGRRKGKTVLVFCNAADTVQRNNLTLRVSEDEGHTWPGSYVVARSDSNERDYAAYSDLVQVDARHIGVLFERNAYHEIVFAIIKL